MKKIEAHCDAYFIPIRWEVIRRLGGGRALLLAGLCGNCCRELSVGLELPAKADSTEFYALVHDALLQWRPSRIEGVQPLKDGDVAQEREHWYQKQDELSTQARRKLFLSLFTGEERDAAARWLDDPKGRKQCRI